jgi:prolyl oligopeptidase
MLRVRVRNMAVMLSACAGQTVACTRAVEHRPAAPSSMSSTATTSAHASAHPDVTETYFGITIHDPYRWLESSSDAAVQQWMEREGEITRRTLDSVPGAADVREAMGRFFSSQDAIQDLHLAGGRLFYLRRATGDVTFRLCMRVLGGAEITLFRLPDDVASSSAISDIVPSPDGAYVAFAVSARGSDQHTVKLIDIKSGSLISDQLDHISDTWMSWRPDKAAFYYIRHPHELDPDPSKRSVESEIAQHVVGTPSSDDRVILSRNTRDAPPMTEHDVPELYHLRGISYEIAVIFHGVTSDQSIYARPMGGGIWREVIAPKDRVADWCVFGHDIFVISRRDAPLGVVGRVNLASPSGLQLLTSSDGRPMKNIVASKEALFVVDEDFKGSRIRRIDPKSGHAVDIPLPFDASIFELVSEPTEDHALFRLEGWSDSSRWLLARDVSLTLEDPFPDQARVSVPGARVEQTAVKSRDGTEIPLTILMRDGAPKEAPVPTILQGYGAYELSPRPAFTSGNAIWLARGGALAIAHTRGGGEFGREWHLAGVKERKKNVVDDFIACAEYLVHSGFTRPDHLAGVGRSAGGIPVGMAMVLRPDLFRAVYLQAGFVNVLRSSALSSAYSDAEEFGSTSSLVELQGLLQTDVYQNVRKGIRYPALMAAVGLNDSNVPPWQGAKLVARMKDEGIGDNPVLLRVQADEGHDGRTIPQQTALMADMYTFLMWQLNVTPTNRSASSTSSSGTQ